MKKSPEAPFVFDMFRLLNAVEIPYCVLRDHEHLPYDTGGHDIDLLVDPGSLDRAFDIIREATRLHAGYLVAYYRRSALITRLCGKESEWWGVAIDVFPLMEYRGIPYYDTQTILENAGDWRNVSVAAERDSAMSAFLKECLTNGKDRKRYASRAAAHYNASSEYFDDMFIRYFGPRMAKDLSSFFAQDGDVKKIQSLCHRARRALWLNALRKNPFRACRYRLIYHFQRLSRLFRTPGIAVAFLGTDGAGKSTIIQRIEPLLKKTMHNAVSFEHMRPNLLPSLARLFGQQTQTGPVTDPHSSSPSGFFGSFLRLVYYTLDYIIGFWLKIYPAMVRKPCIFIFDRYFYDYFFDPVRARISLPKWIIKLFALAIPKPDLILCLGAEPVVIHSRKPELTLEETQKQVIQLKRFCSKTSRAFWIDTDRAVERSIDKTLSTIALRMAARYQ